MFRPIGLTLPPPRLRLRRRLPSLLRRGMSPAQIGQFRQKILPEKQKTTTLLDKSTKGRSRSVVLPFVPFVANLLPWLGGCGRRSCSPASRARTFSEEHL